MKKHDVGKVIPWMHASGLGYQKNTVSPTPSLWTPFHLQEVGLGAIHLEKHPKAIPRTSTTKISKNAKNMGWFSATLFRMVFRPFQVKHKILVIQFVPSFKRMVFCDPFFKWWKRDLQRSGDEVWSLSCITWWSFLQLYITSWWLNHPSEKYARQIGFFPQIGMITKTYLKPPPR